MSIAQGQNAPWGRSPMGFGLNQGGPTMQQYGSGGMNYQGTGNPNISLQPMSMISLPQQRFDLMRQNAANQINRGALIQGQDLQRNYATRGMGRSGLELQAAQEGYRRGAGQQMGDVNRQLSADEMGQYFGEAQKYRDLESQRRFQQAGLGLQKGQLGLMQATQLGDLGLRERAQAMQEAGAQDKYENPGYGLSPLYQSLQSGYIKGGKK